MLDLGQKRDQLRDALSGVAAQVLLPRPDLHVDEWADQNRILPSESSAITGAWSTSAFEVARPFLRAFTEPGVRVMTAMASAQIMKTSGLECVIGYQMHLDPGPMLIYEPTIQTANRFDEDKLEPMLKATPPLADLFGGKRALANPKNPNFLAGHKKFPGGFLYVMTSNSEENLAQTSARIVMYDEVDKMRPVKGNAPISLGDERLKGFSHNSMSIRVSTPTVTGASAIADSYESSDQRKPFMKCPHCGDWHYMKWENVNFKDRDGNSDPDCAAYICESCGVAWSEADRIKPITTDGGVYAFQTKTFECCGETQNPEVERNWEIVEEYRVGYACCKHCGERAVSNRHAGFWAWEAYHPGRPLSDTVRAFLESKGDRDKLRNFVNSKLARTFSEEVDESRKVDPEHIAARAEPPWPGVPSQVEILTLGADVQSGENARIECEIVGWGLGDESWSLGYHVINSDPAYDDAWQELDDILQTPLIGEDGRKHYIQAACVDTGGHHAEEVVSFCRARRARRVWAIKGDSEKAGSRKPIWPKAVSTSKHGGSLYLVGTQSAKDRVERSLQVTQPGHLYMHFPANRDLNWFKQLTAEHRVVVATESGQASMWRPKPGHKRNEALDCRVYAIAALAGLRSAGVVAMKGAPGSGEKHKADTEQQKEVQQAKAKKQNRRRRRRSSSSLW